MCGIIGIASSQTIQNCDWLTVGRDAMRHRGPDDQGEWWSPDHRVGLGHRRLAIIDLSATGHQPMLDPDGSLAITYNGEIYNYRDLQAELRHKGHVFSSKSDTEVILAAYREWGVDCLARFNGMFAFALYDSANQRIFMARDRAGEKPLFYAHQEGELRFASELKGLLADPSMRRKINYEALDLYLAMGFVPGDRCIIQGVSKLPPAHALIFSLSSGEKNTWRYWQLPLAPSIQAATPHEENLLSELEVLLEDAVRMQLEADVPVGILLSGGVDSSLITAMAVRTSDKVKTFTVGFPGSGHYDEREHAKLIARHFATEHVELDAGQMSPDILPDLARQFDEPIMDSSMVPTFAVSQLVRQHCTVALGGDGGDELFGGYHHYDRLLWMQEKFSWMPPVVKSLVGKLAGQVLPMGFKGRNWLQALSSIEHQLPLIASYFDRAPRRHLMNGAGVAPWPLVAEEIRSSRVPDADDLLQRATRMDFDNYMVEDILVKVDRASMLNSLEIRAPFLDYRIIEFTFGKVPSSLKATLHERKILLKKLASRLLPSEFDLKRKQGLSIPLMTWLRVGPWRDLFNEVLLDRDCLFDRRTIISLFTGQDKGRNIQERLFALVMFELWRREYNVIL